MSTYLQATPDSHATLRLNVPDLINFRSVLKTWLINETWSGVTLEDAAEVTHFGAGVGEGGNHFISGKIAGRSVWLVRQNGKLTYVCECKSGACKHFVSLGIHGLGCLEQKLASVQEGDSATQQFLIRHGRWRAPFDVGEIAAQLGRRLTADQERFLGRLWVIRNQVEQDTPADPLTERELRLLASAPGRFVNLGAKGFRRIKLLNEEAADLSFSRLGLDRKLLATGPGESLRYHAIQLADQGTRELVPAAAWDSICERAGAVARPPRPTKPATVDAVLREYQHDGYEFLSFLSHNRFGGILADDMGLGKTLQAITWLMSIKERGTKHPVLVVAPKSVVNVWVGETTKFCPSLRVNADIEAVLPETDVDLHVINYAQLRSRFEVLQSMEWSVVILDEGQNIKNPHARATLCACALRSKYRLVLTGTPIENKLLDLWSLMNFAQPGLLGNITSFKRLYNPKHEDQKGVRARLANRIRHFILRRSKDEVAKDLPPRIEEDILCELSPVQRELYDAELKVARGFVNQAQGEKLTFVEHGNVLRSLTRMRQICCDARLLGLHPHETSGKMDALLESLAPVIEAGHKILVFSQFVEMLKLISATLEKHSIKHLMLTGATENRQELIDKFQATPELPVFLLSLKAGGSGLNLTAASYVVLFDPWWNPAVEAQAIDRTHRIGQVSKVMAYHFLAKDTIEEKMRDLQAQKKEMAKDVIQEVDLEHVLNTETLRQLLA